MLFLRETAIAQFPTYFVAVYALGFIAAVTIGSIAWYNSKRPAGWENADRPDFVPNLDVGEQPTAPTEDD